MRGVNVAHICVALVHAVIDGSERAQVRGPSFRTTPRWREAHSLHPHRLHSSRYAHTKTVFHVRGVGQQSFPPLAVLVNAPVKSCSPRKIHRYISYTHIHTTTYTGDFGPGTDENRVNHGLSNTARSSPQNTHMASSTADFWAGYLSGAIGILVGNPLDLIKTRLQAGTLRPEPSVGTASAAPGSPSSTAHVRWTQQFTHWTTLARGAAAPILGYGALNALLFVTYNRSLSLLTAGDFNNPPPTSSLAANAAQIWTAGALGGLAIFFVSAPTELVKCRAQVGNRSSWDVTKELWRAKGVKGLYLGGAVTAVRDSVGYGF